MLQSWNLFLGSRQNQIPRLSGDNWALDHGHVSKAIPITGWASGGHFLADGNSSLPSLCFSLVSVQLGNLLSSALIGFPSHFPLMGYLDYFYEHLLKKSGFLLSVLPYFLSKKSILVHQFLHGFLLFVWTDGNFMEKREIHASSLS